MRTSSFPAALEGVINMHNAARIKAPLIIEAAIRPRDRGPPDEILAPQGHRDHSRPLRQRGRRHRVLFRMGQEPSATSRFGRMQRDRKSARHQLIVDELERLSADSEKKKKMDRLDALARFQAEIILRGAGELELVRSGLDDTMAARPTSPCARSGGTAGMCPDLRTAGFLVSIDRVAKAYTAKGGI